MRKAISIIVGVTLLVGGAGLFVYMILNQSEPAKLLFYFVPVTMAGFGLAILSEDITDLVAPRKYARGRVKAHEDIKAVLGKQLSYADMLKRRPSHWSDLSIRDADNVEMQAYREAWADHGVQDCERGIFWPDFLENDLYRAGWKLHAGLMREQGKSTPELDNDLEWLLAYERAN